MQLSRQDVEAFMQQKGCPGLPDDVPEWQTPHLAKPPPEEEDEELDEEAAEAKMQEERLAVGEGLVGDLAIVRTKREYSPDGSQDSQEPGSKKQRVGVPCIDALAVSAFSKAEMLVCFCSCLLLCSSQSRCICSQPDCIHVILLQHHHFGQTSCAAMGIVTKAITPKMTNSLCCIMMCDQEEVSLRMRLMTVVSAG